MSVTHAVLELLAQQPSPAPGQSGTDINFTPTAPPGSDKIKLLLGVASWVATAALIGLTIRSGVSFAQAYSEGHASPGQKVAVVACIVGTIISLSAANIITFFS